MKNSKVISVVLGLIVALAASSAFAQGSGQTAPCCVIAAIDASSGLVTARDLTTGSIFQFTAPPALLPQLKIGQRVWVDPATQVVSVEGAPNCCRLAQSSPPSTLGGRPKLEVQTPIRPEVPSRGAPLKAPQPETSQTAPSPGGPLTVATPPPPTGLTANGISPTTVELKWQHVTGTSGYFVWRADPSGVFKQLNQYPLLGTAYTDNGAWLCRFGFYYSYKVAARYPGQSDGVSAPVSVKAPPMWDDRYLDEQICGKRPLQ